MDGEGAVITRCIGLFSWVHSGIFLVTVMLAVIKPVPKDEPSSYIFQILEVTLSSGCLGHSLSILITGFWIIG